MSPPGYKTGDDGCEVTLAPAEVVYMQGSDLLGVFLRLVWLLICLGCLAQHVVVVDGTTRGHSTCTSWSPHVNANVKLFPILDYEFNKEVNAYAVGQLLNCVSLPDYCFNMAVYGALGGFDESIEQFQDYAGRCDAFMSANVIPNDRKVNLFLATIGPVTYKLIKNLCAPDDPNTKTYTLLKTLLQTHFEPPPIVIAERHKFWTASQGENEKVADYVVRLKRLASTCNFGGFLDEALRDRLVSGLHQKMARTQRHLLSYRNLTFTIAREACTADELAGKANKEYMGDSVPVETNRVHQSPKPKNYGQAKKPSYNKRHKEKSGTNTSANDSSVCFRCGAKHSPSSCKYIDATCHGCGKQGHIRPVCKSGKSVPKSGFSKQKVNSVTGVTASDTSQATGDSSNGYGLYTTVGGAMEPYKVQIVVGGEVILMELDTGASRSTVDEGVYKNILSKYPLYDSDIKLSSYTGTNVPLLGCIQVPVQYGSNPTHSLELIVVKGQRPSLLGRDWLSKIRLNWNNIFAISHSDSTIDSNVNDDLASLLKEYKVLFSKVTTGIKLFTASFKLKPEAKPVYQRARPVPYSMIGDAEKEYDRLIDADIFFPVSHSNWASPVVHVPKAQGAVRVCGDYKAINEVIEDDGYKLPNTLDLFAKFAQGGKQPCVYSVIDLAGAFNQLLLDDDSAKLMVLNTHRGLMGTKRLCFGVKTAPAQFQAAMDKILTGIPHVFCYIDDILVATDSVEEHLRVLKSVFNRLAKFNVKLNGEKCLFLKPKIRYLGHILSSDGVRPIQQKVEAIQKAPRPKDVSELKSLLGAINYYGRFMPNLATLLQPLYGLLHHTAEWVWSRDCDKAFQEVKVLLTGDNVLVHFDLNKPLVLSTDASPYGLGAVLSHRLSDGSEKPIAFASRTLSQAERNYPQIEKEALAIIFGIKKFHLYLYGSKFTLVTDHQPLTRIFGPKTGIPLLAAARMQRWALVLSGYNYNIVYRTSADNANADLLSRLPVTGKVEVDPDENYVFNTVVNELPVTAKIIARDTEKDQTLVKVYEYTMSGWPSSCDEPELRPYVKIKDELSVDCGCLLWGRRVIIPSSLRDCLLSELHECHPGMSRMKALARSWVWWPGIDPDIEDLVRSCNACIKFQGSPKTVPLLLWPWATEPWKRIHVDFLEDKGQQFLLVVDSYSKWMEVFPMEPTTAAVTIVAIRNLFARYGLPEEVVSDNGPQFISHDFKNFLKENCVKHTLCPPYHPASNGLAEKHVQTFKRIWKKYEGNKPVDHKVADILFHYRNTPHTTTGKTPAELFLKRTPKIRLSLTKPSLEKRVVDSQVAAKSYHDGKNPRFRSFDLFQRVRVRNLRGGKVKWIPGTVVQKKGPNTYVVRVPGNSKRFVHIDHLIPDDSIPSPTVEGEGDVDCCIPEVPISNDLPYVRRDSVPNSSPSFNAPEASHTPLRASQNSPGITVTRQASTAKSNISNSSPSQSARPDCGAPVTVRTSRAGRMIVPPKRLDL